RTVVVDTGVMGEPTFRADVTRQEVAKAGNVDLAELAAKGDRGTAVSAMTNGVREIAARLHREGKLDAIIALGGGAGTSVGTAAKCVETARAIVERHGYEVLIFHAVGSGGQTMESLIEAGQIAGVLDVTTTEWADELAGGVLSAGPHRLEAAAKSGTPA